MHVVSKAVTFPIGGNGIIVRRRCPHHDSVNTVDKELSNRRVYVKAVRSLMTAQAATFVIAQFPQRAQVHDGQALLLYGIFGYPQEHCTRSTGFCALQGASRGVYAYALPDISMLL